VLADREFGIGRFYYLRMAYPAAIARLKTLVDRYPLYSGADQALYLIGQSYEAEIDVVRRNGRMNEVAKSKAIDGLTRDAAAAYSRIIQRYPAMDAAVDAKDRLEALHQPVPRPTRAMLEQNKKEIASRHEATMVSTMLRGFERHPDVAKATHLGDPTMVDPPPVTAGDVVRSVTNSMAADNRLGVQTINGKVAPNQDAPRSDAPPAATDDAAAASTDQAASTPDTASPAAELKPTVADPNELKPNVAQDPNALPPLQQSNQIDTSTGTSAATSSSTSAKTEEMADISSSKKKKKKGIAKINPF